MEEERKEEEQKTGEEPEESAETVEEAKAEAEEEIEEVSEEGKEEIPERGEEVVEETGEVKAEEVSAPAEGEEAKPPERKEKVEEEEIVEEKIYTVPLGRCWIAPSDRRARSAMQIIRGFVVKHMKLEKRAEGEEEEEPKRLVISNEVNERIWGRGAEKPPRRIRIRAAKDKEGNVTVYLAEGD